MKLEMGSNGVLVCNTGSITFPKGGNPPTFATIDEDSFVRIRDIEGNILKEKHFTNPQGLVLDDARSLREKTSSNLDSVSDTLTPMSR